jgi:hypothetical protein
MQQRDVEISTLRDQPFWRLGCNEMDVSDGLAYLTDSQELHSTDLGKKKKGKKRDQAGKGVVQISPDLS